MASSTHSPTHGIPGEVSSHGASDPLRTTRLFEHLIGISPVEVDFEHRGFRLPQDEAVREHLEMVGRSFVAGYAEALRDGRPTSLGRRLDRVATEFRGFAYEGAAMALTLTDLLSPWRRPRLEPFLAGPGAPHTYLVHVGAGWALARAPMRIGRLLARLHPVHRWLALDGWGFHQGYFHAAESVEERRVPRRARRYGGGYGRRVFDQGLGRSLWFVCGADAEGIAVVIGRFEEDRRDDLWSGAGLACAYAGGAGRREVERLAELAGEHRPTVAQGAAFAAKARQLGGNLTPATDTACRVLCGMPAEEAAAVPDEAARELPPDGAEPAFEVWRRRIRERFTEPTSRGHEHVGALRKAAR